jgi:hypothetical protein
MSPSNPAHAARRLLAHSLGLAALALASSNAKAQTWTRVTRNPPAAVNLMLLLPDGTVMASRNDGTNTIGNGWYRLTPDSHGSYVNGTWTTLASMHDTRLYYSAQVLTDGRVFVAGGEYGSGRARAEVYNPATNVWTPAPIPTTLLNPSANSPVTGGPQGFSDSNSEILANGNVMITPVAPSHAGQTVMYNPTTNTWSAGPNLFRGAFQDEASWVKLPDNTILTIDPFGTNSERYNPASNTWINDSNVPVSLYDPFGSELGAAFLLPSGRAFYLGATGHTALYTPSGTTAPGVWAAGPDIPGGHGTPDAPAAMLVTGHILCAVSPIPNSGNHFPTPTTFYEYDPVANAFSSVTGPAGSSDNIPSYKAAMLDLPDGSVLYSHMATSVYTYRPAGAPLPAGQPVIGDVTPNADGSYHLTGTGLNGISEGAAYGDDLQMASNYPLVRINHSDGNTYYARTYNWSSTGVMTGSQIVTTEFSLPATLPPGSYSLVVVANGIASEPFTPACVAPSISTDPTPQSACSGGSGSATFTVSAAGDGPLTYQWRRGTTALTNGGNISGADTATLTISPVTPADAGSDYNVLVTSACAPDGIASNTTTLTICVPDANCDGHIDVQDFLSFLALYAAADPRADVDASGQIDVSDFLAFLSAFAAGCP